MKTIITIRGTHCPACKALIEEVCKEMTGVTSCAVDYQTGRTEIGHGSAFDWTAFKNEVEGLAGYNIQDEQTAFVCSTCGLRYKERETAARCEAWCSANNSCNLSITVHAIKESR